MLPLMSIGIIIGCLISSFFLFVSISIKSSNPKPVDNMSPAEHLHHQVRILCCITIEDKNHKATARRVKDTWGKRCNKLVFISSEVDTQLNVLALPKSEALSQPWGKAKETYKYIYAHYLDDADWFLKANDDTYTIVENLRYMLYPHNPDSPVYFGCKFKPYVKQAYISEGTDYVLSREALRRFVVEAIPNPKMCKSNDTGSEDEEMPKCLENVNVEALNSKDANGRSRFLPFVPRRHKMPMNKDKRFCKREPIFYKTEESLECCPTNAITFHYVSPDQMQVLEYFIYHLKPYGIVNVPGTLPKRLAGS